MSAHKTPVTFKLSSSRELQARIVFSLFELMNCEPALLKRVRQGYTSSECLQVLNRYVGRGGFAIRGKILQETRTAGEV